MLTAMTTAQDAMRREWLVTNGIGGFASGTVADLLTRRYHGLLFAALEAPLGRTLLLAKLDASVAYNQRSYPIATNLWADGTLDPQGYRSIQRFALEGSIPTWRYAFADALLERRIWMETGENTTYVRYTLHRGDLPLHLTLRAQVNAREYHSLVRAYDVADPTHIDGLDARVQLSAQAPVLHVSIDRGSLIHGDGWNYGFRLQAETERGLDDLEDHYHALDVVVTLLEGDSVTVRASTQAPAAPLDADRSHAARASRDAMLLDRWKHLDDSSDVAPSWIAQLVLAADQFVVSRATARGPGKTIIAGYPWFGDWGRDTMIALPGLAILTGNAPIARDILTTFAAFVDRGMIPNRFPDTGATPEYNTADATLWFVEAIRYYVEMTGDSRFAAEMLDVIENIIGWHQQGTRYNIHVDERDGLLFAGAEGVQLTWMDAKVGGDVITPRIGKPVEINALWYRALKTAEAFARSDPKRAQTHAALAQRVRASFERFWNPATAYCYDVIDGPAGDDPSIRPNAVIAAGLPDAPFSTEQRASIVRTAARELLTSFGLRSLSPNDPRYVGHYGGNQENRDRAYHQGTVWPWLLGPFISAHLSVYGDAVRAREFLEPMQAFIDGYAIGTLAEIADGDAPYDPRGCIAQAWSVGETLRAWHNISRLSKEAKSVSR